MCGRIHIKDNSFVQLLLEELFVENPQAQLYSNFVKPCDTVSIITQDQGSRTIKPAMWWLLLDEKEQGFKPSRFTSFNTRFDKLAQPGSAGFIPFKSSRCIIPATGFGETQTSKGNASVYHDLVAVERAIAFAGLYRSWQHSKTGEVVHSCSIITNAPHIKLAQIHTKASPATLLPSEYESWLDCKQTKPQALTEVLKPRIAQNFHVQQINKPSLQQAIGAPFTIQSDLVGNS